MTDFPTFDGFIDQLAQIAQFSKQVVGLVTFGSTTEPRCRDEWSDHDFVWLTEPGHADAFRHDLSWLPHAPEIALSVTEHHGGVKVIYRNGHRLEFGVTDIETFSHWSGAPTKVIVGDESVYRASAVVAARQPTGTPNAAREIRLMLTQIHSGVGRARRGEVLSGSHLVRGEAVDHLVRAAAERLPADTSRLDVFDPRRRFEFLYPQLGTRLEKTVRLSVEAAANEIVLIAEQELEPGWPEFPHEGLAAVRARFGWN